MKIDNSIPETPRPEPKYPVLVKYYNTGLWVLFTGRDRGYRLTRSDGSPVNPPTLEWWDPVTSPKWEVAPRPGTPEPAKRPLAPGDLKRGDVIQWTNSAGTTFTEQIEYVSCGEVHGTELHPNLGDEVQHLFSIGDCVEALVRYPDAKLVLGAPETHI